MDSLAQLEGHLATHLDDWPSWLVYGDHLTEQGDVRGELIRLEHRLSLAAPTKRRALEKEVAALIGAHQKSWTKTAPSSLKIDWRHGFIVGLELGWLEPSGAQLDAFFSTPDSRMLTRLVVSRMGAASDAGDEDDDGELEEAEFDEEAGHAIPKIDEEQITAALDGVLSLDLSRLSALGFGYLGLGDFGAKRLAKAESLGGVKHLDLRYNFIGDGGLSALCRAGWLKKLHSLHLQGNELRSKSIKALSALELPELKVLDLRLNALGGAGAKSLAAARFLGTLTRLGLQREDIGLAGVKTIAKAPMLAPNLRPLWKGMASVKPVESENTHDED